MVLTPFEHFFGITTMQAVIEADAPATEHAPMKSKFRLRQILAIIRLEARKNVFNRRAFPVYLLAALPVLLAIGIAITPPMRKLDAGQIRLVFANLFELVILRMAVFFGCARLFMNLFQGEQVEQSLHYYFLTPVRREVLVLGKYCFGVVTTGVILGISTIVSFTLVAIPFAGKLSLALDGRYLVAYVGTVLVACVGYGAVFLLLGILFRNPIVPAILIYGLEIINFLLPPFLKHVSVIHYLRSLSPIQISQGPFAVVAELVPAPIAVMCIVGLAAAFVGLSAWMVRTMEVKYAGE